jgi:GNAT superfamily N-acetyltransferase
LVDAYAVDLVERVCAAYSRQRALGHQSACDALCRVVSDERHPQLWAANHVSAVRARTHAEIAEVMHRAELAFAHCEHRLFVVDPLTPAPFVAALAQDDYNELTPTILLALEGQLRRAPRELDIRPVTSEDDWASIERLVAEDHSSAVRSQGRALPPEVTRAMVASYRSKVPDCQFFVARIGRLDCAYGAGVWCGDGIAVIEDLFTLPAYRRRGVATALIARAIAHVQARGASTVLIGAHATERPKRLYAALGFVPLCLTREYIRHAG